MLDISKITTNLDRREDGIWVARDQRDVSYPEDGNESCFAVEDTSFWFCHRNNVISQLVRKFSPSTVFFDIGGGNGCVSNALQSAGNDVVLVEPGTTGVFNAKRRGVRTVVQSPLEDAGFARESLPAAGLFDVVEHIENDAEFLRLIYDYLQSHGILYVTVPAFQFLWSNDDVRAGHFRRYTTNSLSGLLTQRGFDVRYCSYLFSFLVPPIFLLRSVPSWMGFRKSVSQATTEKEHTVGAGLMNSAIQRLLNFELTKVKNGKPIGFGSSCIAVATKNGITNR
jgi:SAM-dependent methyltransferase